MTPPLINERHFIVDGIQIVDKLGGCVEVFLQVIINQNSFYKFVIKNHTLVYPIGPEPQVCLFPIADSYTFEKVNTYIAVTRILNKEKYTVYCELTKGYVIAETTDFLPRPMTKKEALLKVEKLPLDCQRLVRCYNRMGVVIIAKNLDGHYLLFHAKPEGDLTLIPHSNESFFYRNGITRVCSNSNFLYFEARPQKLYINNESATKF